MFGEEDVSRREAMSDGDTKCLDMMFDLDWIGLDPVGFSWFQTRKLPERLYQSKKKSMIDR